MKQFFTVASAILKAQELEHEAHIVSLEADAFMHGSDAWAVRKAEATLLVRQARAILNRIDEE